MDLTDSMNFMMKDSDLAIHENEAVFLFGMSKMTVVLESENSSQYKYLIILTFQALAVCGVLGVAGEDCQGKVREHGDGECHLE